MTASGEVKLFNIFLKKTEAQENDWGRTWWGPFLNIFPFLGLSHFFTMKGSAFITESQQCGPPISEVYALRMGWKFPQKWELDLGLEGFAAEKKFEWSHRWAGQGQVWGGSLGLIAG